MERIELITTEPRQVVVVELVRAGRSVDRQARMFAVQSRFRRASA